MSDARLTRCPKCQTIFRVTPAQLKKARGKVRCGSCSHVFDARGYLLDDTSAATPTTSTKPTPQHKPVTPPTVTSPPALKALQPDKPSTPTRPVEKAAPQFIDSIIDEHSRYTNLDKLGSIQIPGEILLPETPAPTPVIAEEKPRAAETPRVEATAKESKAGKKKTIYEDTEAKTPPPTADDLEGINILYEAASQQIDATPAELETEEIVLNGGVESTKSSTQHIDLDNFSDSFLADDLEEPHGADTGKAAVATATPRKKSGYREPHMPFSLRHSMSEVEETTRPPWLTSLMIFLFLLLLAGLIIQAVIFRSVQLVDTFPRLAGTMSWFCSRLPCRYSGERDVGLIELVSRDVRSHPSAKNALLITVTLQNQAQFKQPYPMILLSLSNLGGQVIARRQFSPQEYLDKLYTPFLRMEPGTPVHITLAVMDPGEDAVNFEFSFQ